MKTTTFLLLLFLSSFAAFGQSIELHQPSKRLCTGSENVLHFSFTGDFPSDETFNLYSVGNSEPYLLLLDSAKSSPIKFTPHQGYYPLIIESKKTKIRSNIIYVDIAHTIVRIDYHLTKACTGYSVPIKLRTSNIIYDKIQWLKDGNDIPGANDYTYYATESGNYYVRLIQDGCPSLDSLAGHVDIKIGEIEPPRISARFKNFNVCDTIVTHLNSYFRGISDEKFQWQLNGKDIPGATESSYIATQLGNYTLKVSQGTCQAISNNERLDLVSYQIRVSPTYWDNKGVAEICEGVEFDLQSPYSGSIFDNKTKQQWQKDGIDIESATNYTYRVKSEGTYRLKTVRGNCITFSNTILVKYGKPKLVNLNIAYKEHCIGEEVTAGVWWSNDFGAFSQKATVYRNNQPFSEAGYNGTFKVKESGNYHAALNFTLPNSTKICTAYSDTIKVEFKDKIVNYEIQAIQPLDLCSDNMIISGNPVESIYQPKYQWTFNGENLPDAKDFKITAKQSGTYQLEAKTELGCSYISNPVTIQLEKLYPKINKYWTICSDSLQRLNVSVKRTTYNSEIIIPIGGTSVEWELNGKIIEKDFNHDILESGVYKVTVKKGECIGTDSIKVDASEIQVNIPKTLSPNQDSLFICPNGAVSIEAAKGDYTYMWLKDNQGFDTNQSQAIKVSAQGTYRAWIEKEGCGRISDAVVVKEKIVLPTALISGSKELMHGDSAKIKVDFTSLPPWAFKLTNNQEFTANTTPFEFAVKPEQTTVYELASVKNDCGEGTVNGKAEIRIIILGNEELAGAKVKLFPVPTQGICQLSVETVVPEKLGFQLYNVEGKMLMQTQENQASLAFKEQINLESLPDGVYLLKIKVGDKLLSRKIIKRGN